MGEEVLRIGKLNLVDLAGSENIGRYLLNNVAFLYDCLLLGLVLRTTEPGRRGILTKAYSPLAESSRVLLRELLTYHTERVS